MNNNRGGNNRRRGRGNNNNRQQGGGQQINRIDSRARGNAPQMLEKYRKLAHDSHLNGDRVTEEYYLQFADHYFRVIADTRVRQDEARQRREGWQEGGNDAERDPYRDDSDGGDDGGEYGVDDGGYASYAQQQQPQPRREQRDERPRRDDRGNGNPGGNPGANPGAGNRGERNGNAGNAAAADDAPRVSQDNPGEQPVGDQGSVEVSADNPYEPSENPFVRDNRARTPRPRREGTEERRPRAPRVAKVKDDAPAGLDPAALPPAIATPRAEPEAPAAAAAEAEEKPRRRTRRPRPPADGEALETAG